MERRTFLRDSALLAFSVGVFGKIKWDGQAYVGEDPTTTDVLGPLYRPGAPFKTDLVRPGEKGEILHFGGTIFGKDGKTPVKGALVEVWHCDETGEYDNTSDDYVHRASFITKTGGKYQFRTILPGQYGSRPAHIHMRISGNSGTQDLVTQIYFKGDTNIPGDSSASDKRSLNRILEISENGRKEKVVKFDIYLRKEYLLDAASFQKISGVYLMKEEKEEYNAEFYRNGDQLFAKVNGQIMEAMDYIGNNQFEGGLSGIKVQFEIMPDGGAKAKLSYAGEKDELVTIEGNKSFKY